MVSLISFDVKQQKTKLYCCDKILKQKKQGTCPSFKSYKKVANCGLRFTGFKPTNTLCRIYLKVKKHKEATKKVLRTKKVRCRVPVKYSEVKMQQSMCWS